MRIPLPPICRLANEAGKICLPFNIFVLTLTVFLCRAARTRRSILLSVHLLIDAAQLLCQISNFSDRLHNQGLLSSWTHRLSILPKDMYKTRFQSFCQLRRPPRLSKWLRLIRRSVPLHSAARSRVASGFRIRNFSFQCTSCGSCGRCSSCAGIEAIFSRRGT